MRSDAIGSYAPVDVLRATFPARLTDVTDLIIAWFVLGELLGRRGVRVYDGSWAEWGFDPETPVESEAPTPPR